MTRRALILGITGQIGSFLAERLLADGYQVHGVIRRSSVFNTQRIDHIFPQLTLYHGDINDGVSLRRALEQSSPDEVYNLAAQSHVRVSFDVPESTCMVTGQGVVEVFEAVRAVKPDARIFQASSSEIFGNAHAPQDEQTPIEPVSPYGCAKAFGYHLVKMYRQAYRMYAVNGICFNVESERRGETFVTRKITRAVGRIVAGRQDHVVLGNLDAIRDWNYATDTVDAIVKTLRQRTPDDYVIGRGVPATVAEFARLAFDRVGLRWQDHVRTDDRYRRPAEVDRLIADAIHARVTLGWQPQVSLNGLVARMVDHDVALAKREIQ